MTRAELILWSKLKGRQFHGFKFRRQQGIGPFIVDFYCPELKLAIEIDGDTHFEPGAEERDRTREKKIERHGVQFLRFMNVDIYYELYAVLETIAQKVHEVR